MEQNLIERAARLAEKTNDAYSSDRYASWASVAKKLLAAGYDAFAAEAIMRSKWARWAADRSPARYGRVPAKALLDYANEATGAELREIVEGTFPEIKQARLDREAAAPIRKAQESLDEENRLYANRVDLSARLTTLRRSLSDDLMADDFVERLTARRAEILRLEADLAKVEEELVRVKP